MFKWLTHSKDGHKLPPVGVEIQSNGWTIEKRHIFITFPGGFLLTISVGFEADVQRQKVLANTDFVPYNEPIAPDDWRDQPRRRNGLPW